MAAASRSAGSSAKPRTWKIFLCTLWRRATMTANATSLVPRRTHGWRMGFANMLAKENAAWWRTRRWWIQSLVAIFFVDGTMLANHQLTGASIERIASFNNLLVIAGVLAIAAI